MSKVHTRICTPHSKILCTAPANHSCHVEISTFKIFLTSRIFFWHALKKDFGVRNIKIGHDVSVVSWKKKLDLGLNAFFFSNIFLCFQKF